MEGVAGGFIQAQDAFARQDLMEAQTQNQRQDTQVRALQALATKRKMMQEQQALAAQQQLMQAVQGIKLTGDFAQDQMRVAETALQHGDLDSAAKFLNQGSQAAERALQGKAHLALAGERQTKRVLDETQVLLSGTAGIRDQASMDEWSKEYEAATGRQSPLRGQLWSPDLVRRYRSAELERLGKVPEDYRDRRLDLLEEGQRIRENYYNARLGIMERANEIRAQAADRRGSRAGSDKPIPDPTKADIEEVQAYIATNWPGVKMSDKNERTLASTQIYYRAHEKMKNHPGLSKPDALQQALDEFKAQGLFREEEKGSNPLKRFAPSLFGEPERNLRYGKSAEGSSAVEGKIGEKGKPLGLKPDAPFKDLPPPTSRPSGWYSTSKGVFYWTGEGWDPDKKGQ